MDLGRVYYEPLKDRQGNILLVTLKDFPNTPRWGRVICYSLFNPVKHVFSPIGKSNTESKEITLCEPFNYNTIWKQVYRDAYLIIKQQYLLFISSHFKEVILNNLTCSQVTKYVTLTIVTLAHLYEYKSSQTVFVPCCCLSMLSWLVCTTPSPLDPPLHWMPLARLEKNRSRTPLLPEPTAMDMLYEQLKVNQGFCL